jgi:hypothetical protein
MQKLFILLCLFIVSSQTYAQVTVPNGACGILYKYDAAGNRISQEYYCNTTGGDIVIYRTMPTGDGKPIVQNTTPDSELTADKVSLTFLKVDALYPNPTTGRFTITFSTPLNNATLLITDANGKAVQQKSGFTGFRVDMDLSGMPSGIYFIRISLAGGKFITHKVVKQ